MTCDHPGPGLEQQLCQLWQLSFGDSEDFISRFFAAAYTPERCRCITIAGQAAAALYWFDAECRGQKFAYLYAVATHPSFRRRGLCRALMEDTQGFLAGQGYAGTLLMPAEDALRRMYGAMGYFNCGTISEFRAAAGAPLPLRRLSTEQYARLRRNLLPQAGVIQEGKTLECLAMYATFYAGADFVLAAAPEDGLLRGIELLGSRNAAPGILGALGFSEGIFRAPGAGLPFAMFRPLKADITAPAYFGLALD